MGNIIKLNDTLVAGNTNSDFAIPEYGKYHILYGQVILTTDATVADRRVIFRVLDDSTTPVVMYDTHAGGVVAASASDQHHEFMQGIYRETSFVGSSLQVPIPHKCLLDEGWTLRILIENGVAGDSFDAHFVADDLGHRRHSK